MKISESESSERRIHRRVFFTPDDNITGQFLARGFVQKPITAFILNLSMGGLYLTPKKGRNSDFKKGEPLVFMQLHAPNSDPLILNIDAEIRWIMDPAMLEYIGIGCSFTKLSDSSRTRLEGFMNTY